MRPKERPVTRASIDQPSAGNLQARHEKIVPMLEAKALLRAELYFRTYLHTVMPLHISLVEEMCAASETPLELATVLEDIGQHYMDLASEINGTLIRRRRLDEEPDPEDYGEARIEEFLDALGKRAGHITFADGETLDGGAALNASPVVRDAIRTAILIARSCKAPQDAPEGRVRQAPAV